MKKFGLTTRIMIGLKRYRRLSEELIFNILFEYQHTAVSFVAKTYGISKATVYNLVNSFEMPKLNIERFEKDDDSPVYMEIDEDHMKCRRSRNTYKRMVAIHRGIEKLCKDKIKLSFKQAKSLFKKKDKEKSNVPHFLCKLRQG